MSVRGWTGGEVGELEGGLVRSGMGREVEGWMPKWERALRDERGGSWKDWEGWEAWEAQGLWGNVEEVHSKEMGWAGKNVRLWFAELLLQYSL